MSNNNFGGEATKANLAAYFSVIFTGLLGVCFFVVWRYAEDGFPKMTYISNTIGYFVSFGIILVVPIDIATVIFDRNESSKDAKSIYDANIVELSEAYAFFFTTIVILGGFYLVFEEYYNTDGNFTIWTKMKSSFYRMVFDTVLMVIVGLVILYLLISEKIVPGDGEALKLTAIIVTNTVYEAFLMFLLGYGLVEFPRLLWNSADLNFRLTSVRNKAASDFKDITDCHFNISLEVANALQTNKKIIDTQNMDLRMAMETILSECPSEFRASKAGTAAVDKTGEVTIETLGLLRTNLKFHKSRYRMAQAKVENTKLEAYSLEDIMDAVERNSNETDKKYDGNKVINWSLTGKPGSEREYEWIVNQKPILMKFYSVAMALLSIFSFIGVVSSMGGISEKSNVYYLAVHSASATQGGIVVFIFFTLGYTVYVTLWSLFQMKFAGLMDLVTNQTTPESLSFNVRMVSRLAAPLVFFYLGWLAENGINSGEWNNNNIFSPAVNMPSAFSNFYQLQDVKIIKNTFGTIFPIVLISFTFLSLTNCYNYVMIMFGLSYLQFGTPIATEEQLREGMRQLNKTKKNAINRARRKRFKNYLLRIITGDTQDDHTDNVNVNVDSNNKVDGTCGWFSSLFSTHQSGSDDSINSAYQVDADIEENHIELPPDCSGTISWKKGSLMTSWIELYAEVRAPGTLDLFMTKEDSKLDKHATATAFPEPIDLKQLSEIKILSKNNLVLYSNKLVITFKLIDQSHAEEWKRKILLWKDFANDHGAEYIANMTSHDLNNLQITVDDDHDHTHAASSLISRNQSNSFNNKTHSSNISGMASSGVEMSNVLNQKANIMVTTSTSDADADTDIGADDGDNIRASNMGEEKPKSIAGYVEMKSGHNFIGDVWTKVYFTIDEKNKNLLILKSADPSQAPQEIISLPSVKSIQYYNNKGTDHKRFNILLGDEDKDGKSEKAHKFRVNSEMDGKKWVEGLNDWKDWFLLNW
jgi:hypothetical protein